MNCEACHPKIFKSWDYLKNNQIRFRLLRPPWQLSEITFLDLINSVQYFRELFFEQRIQGRILGYVKLTCISIQNILEKLLLKLPPLHIARLLHEKVVYFSILN